MGMLQNKKRLWMLSAARLPIIYLFFSSPALPDLATLPSLLLHLFLFLHPSQLSSVLLSSRPSSTPLHPLHFTLAAVDCSVESRSERREGERQEKRYAERKRVTCCGGGTEERKESERDRDRQRGRERNERVVTGSVCV